MSVSKLKIPKNNCSRFGGSEGNIIEQMIEYEMNVVGGVTLVLWKFYLDRPVLIQSDAVEQVEQIHLLSL
jgi:hypothetical protein